MEWTSLWGPTIVKKKSKIYSIHKLIFSNRCFLNSSTLCNFSVWLSHCLIFVQSMCNLELSADPWSLSFFFLCQDFSASACDGQSACHHVCLHGHSGPCQSSNGAAALLLPYHGEDHHHQLWVCLLISLFLCWSICLFADQSFCLLSSLFVCWSFCLSVWLLTAFGAVLQGSLFGMAGLLPASYTTPIMSGQGLAGTFAAFAMICAIASKINSLQIIISNSLRIYQIQIE